MARPRPVPVSFVEKNGTNSFAAASSGTPEPLSSTAIRVNPAASPSPRSATRPARGPAAAASHAFFTRFTSARRTRAASANAAANVPFTSTATPGVSVRCSSAISSARARRSHGPASSRSGRPKKRKSPVTRATCSASVWIAPSGEARPAEDRSRRVPELVRDARRHLAERRQLAAGRQLALEAPRRRAVLEEKENAQDRLRGIQDRDGRELDEARVGPLSERELLRERRRAAARRPRRLADRGHRVDRGLCGRRAELFFGETKELAGRDVRLREA